MPSLKNTVVELKLRTTRRPFHEPGPSIEVHAHQEAVSNFLRLHGIWQRPLTVFADRFLLPGEVAVDVGAHIGYFATVFADAVGPQGTVYAFEPDPTNFAILERNRARNGFDQIICQALAVSDRSEAASLHRSGTNLWGSSLVKRASHSSELAVHAVTLDQALARETRPVGLIKIDVEGAELSVLRGMAETLARQPVPPAVILEFAPKQMEADDPGLGFFQDLIARHGFQVRPFMAHVGPKVLPPRVDVETLTAIHRDFLRYDEGAELDLLLIAPKALERWNR